MVIALAFLLLVPVFALRSIAGLDFWWLFSGSALILTVAAAAADKSLIQRIREDFSKELLSKSFYALASAAFLYFVFLAGHLLSTGVFPFAAGNIQSVYAMRGDASLLRVVLLIALVIGPAEEIFWRGYVQRKLSARFGGTRGLVLAALLYALVHIGSFNPMLILAALVCGFYWGTLYLWKRSLFANCLSHVFWDLAVFVAFPFG